MNNDPIQSVLEKYGNKIISDVTRTWNSLNSIDGKANINFKIVSSEENSITGRLSASGQKAWIAEYGKGSLMDTEAKNPYLSRYKSNPKRWNKLRKGHFVTGRPKEPYRDLDNVVHFPSGRLAGRNLEKNGLDDYKPSKPYHVIQDIVKKDNALKAMFKENLTNTMKKIISIEVKKRR